MVYWIGLLGLKGNENAVAVTVGAYTFRSAATEDPYPVGIYAVWRNTLYTLEEAYQQGLIADSDLPAIYQEHRAWKIGAYDGFDD